MDRQPTPTVTSKGWTLTTDLRFHLELISQSGCSFPASTHHIGVVFLKQELHWYLFSVCGSPICNGADIAACTCTCNGVLCWLPRQLICSTLRCIPHRDLDRCDLTDSLCLLLTSYAMANLRAKHAPVITYTPIQLTSFTRHIQKQQNSTKPMANLVQIFSRQGRSMIQSLVYL